MQAAAAPAPLAAASQPPPNYCKPPLSSTTTQLTEFQLVADRTLGELWTRIERGLREAEGEASARWRCWLGAWKGGRAAPRSVPTAKPPTACELPPQATPPPQAFDYSVLPESHGLRVLLPYDGQMCIRCARSSSMHAVCIRRCAQPSTRQPSTLPLCSKEPERGALVVETNLFEARVGLI